MQAMLVILSLAFFSCKMRTRVTAAIIQGWVRVYSQTHSLIDSDRGEVGRNFPKAQNFPSLQETHWTRPVFQQARVEMRKRWVIMPSTWSYELFGHTTVGQLAFTMGRRRPEGGHTF